MKLKNIKLLFWTEKIYVTSSRIIKNHKTLREKKSLLLIIRDTGIQYYQALTNGHTCVLATNNFESEELSLKNLNPTYPVQGLG